MAQKKDKQSKSDILQRIWKNPRNSPATIQKRLLVFLVFVILSTFGWILRALSETYVADVRYPVEYINFPTDKYITRTPPNKLILRIRSDGFTILNSKLMPKRKLEFDVKSFSLNSLESDSSTVYIITRYARDELSSDLSKKKKNVEILFISPDTIFFHFDQLVHKKLAIKTVLDKSQPLLMQQYMLNGEIFTIPDSVTAVGPTHLVDSLTFAYTELISVKALSDTLIKSIRLAEIPSIEYSQKKTRLIIPVDRFTESSFEVPISIRNVPDSFRIMKIFPKKVNISFRVGLSQFSAVNSSQFSPYLDFLEVDPEIDSRVNVTLDSIPPFVSNVRINPRNVEFLFEKIDLSARLQEQ